MCGLGVGWGGYKLAIEDAFKPGCGRMLAEQGQGRQSALAVSFLGGSVLVAQVVGLQIGTVCAHFHGYLLGY